MRPERLYLLDILEAAKSVRFHISDRERRFWATGRVRAAVLHESTVIGEAAARLPAAFQSRHPEVPWAKIVAFRNFVVHQYFGLDWPIVWDTATVLVPALHEQVGGILEAEFGGSDATV